MSSMGTLLSAHPLLIEEVIIGSDLGSDRYRRASSVSDGDDAPEWALAGTTGTLEDIFPEDDGGSGRSSNAGTGIAHGRFRSPPAVPFAELESLYDVRTREDVRRFVSLFPALGDVLRRAPGEIYRLFPRARLTLELVTDPELDGVEQLFLLVHTSQSMDAAEESLGQLEDTWWLDASEHVGSDIVIDIEPE